MLDTLIRGGTVIDGTGRPGFTADVAIEGGKITAVGKVNEAATETIEAAGLIVTPGFIDPHTHYDAQLFWDPYANPSNIHGVTTVLGGNCGFTLAPLQDRDADYLRRMMAQVEGMSLEALETGLPWNWHSFGEFLDRLEGKIGVNAAFCVGHSALRRTVMGEDAVGHHATPEQIEQMVQLLHESLAGGGFGLSSSLSFTHMDGDGNPVPSRHSDRWAEMIPMARAVATHPGTTLELITDGCLSRFSDDEVDFMTAMSVEAQRPLNWNLLGIDANDRERYEHQLGASKRAAAKGAKVIALTMPANVPNTMSFLTYCALQLLPGWKDILRLPVPERIEKMRDPATRAWMMEQAKRPEAGTLSGLVKWDNYMIGDTFSAANEGLKGRTIGEVAAERGQTTTDCIFDVVINDELQTILWPGARGDNDASWKLRAEAWNDEHVLIGGSDAGAHLDRMCGAGYPTQFVRDCLDGRKLIPVERAVQLMTQRPARLFGLTNRGELKAGNFADVAVLDPATVGSGEVHRTADLPGGSWRLTREPSGVERVLVNGQTSVIAGKTTGRTAGTLLRSGRDTHTVLPGA